MTEKEMFIKCAKESDIKVENFSITKVIDYTQAVKFFEKLRMCKVQLGMDMASSTCSGDVEIVGLPSGDVRLIEHDNSSDDYFKFKSMVIICGNLDDPESSPEIFIESDEDSEWLREYAEEGYMYVGEGRYLGLETKTDDMIVYNKKRIDEYLDLEEESYYDSDIASPILRRIVKNTKREIIAYINVQECMKRHDGNMILFKAHTFTCDEFIEIFSKKYKNVSNSR